MKQVCVQPPPSAINATLTTFAAERRAVVSEVSKIGLK